MEESKKIVVESKRMIMREVNSTDSDFIYDLRKERGEFMNNSSFTRESNRNWIKQYESVVDENHYYFIAQNRIGERLCIGRLHDIDYDKSEFSIGSYLIAKEAPFDTGLVMYLMMGDFAFNTLNLKKGFSNASNDNSSSISIQKKIGAELLKIDDTNHYFIYKKTAFQLFKQKYSKVL